MINNTLTCYVCKKEIKNEKDCISIGKDLVTQKELHRHPKCKPGLPNMKVRKKWTINPKTKIKQSDKIYNRKKAKQQFRKDLKE